MSSRRMLLSTRTKYLAVGIVTGLGLSVVGAGYYYRPLPLSMEEEKDETRYKKTLGRRDHVQRFISSASLTDRADQPIPPLVLVGRQIIIFFGVTISRFLLTTTGDFSVVQDHRYMNFLNRLLTRESGRGLLTVSNHRSLVDEPCILSSILPYWMNIQPKFVRYSLCGKKLYSQ